MTRKSVIFMAMSVAVVILLSTTLYMYWGRQEPAPRQLPLAGEAQDATATQAPRSGSKRVVPDRQTVSATERRTALMPPAGTPLKQALPELQARARAGDSAAAARLFHDSTLCARARRFADNIRSSDALLSQDLHGAGPEKLKGTDAMLEILQEESAFVSQNSALCGGLTADEEAAAMPAALQSALLGDTLAADCYIGSNFSLVPGGMMSHPEWLTDYKEHALDIANHAIEQGDWTMVALMQLAYSKQGNSLLSQVTGKDPLQYYRYSRLWRLGMKSKQDQDYLDSQLAKVASTLTAEQQSDADAWAQDVYNRSFRSNPDGANSSINSCPVDQAQ